MAAAIARRLDADGRSRLGGIVAGGDGITMVNDAIRAISGIESFFPFDAAVDECRRALAVDYTDPDLPSDRQWGDFQTPSGLAARVCDLLASRGVHPRTIIEPTYGAGSFIREALARFSTIEQVYGVEIQERYRWDLKMTLLADAFRDGRSGAGILLHCDDIFTHSFDPLPGDTGDILIIGNPPWVTNAELGTIGSRNLPAKRNFKALNGLDAMTGRSNFDIGEYVIVRMLECFAARRGVLAMLCKNAVIRSVVEILPKLGLPCGNLQAFEIDASREFGASVDASLLVIDLGTPAPSITCAISSFDHPGMILRRFGWLGNRLVADIDRYEPYASLDGASPFIWRQGVKHDCARVMELRERDGARLNADDSIVDIEEEWIYPLLKSSDIRSFTIEGRERSVIVTQRRIGEDTATLRDRAPKLWRYLETHAGAFEGRRSSIYRNAPPFSIFGVGDYSFKPYKVAISGLYKNPVFSLITPIGGRPVMLDDTCYFLGFDSHADALITALLLNSRDVLGLLSAITFTDAKRPFTKRALMRIDIGAVAAAVSYDDLCGIMERVGYRAEEIGEKVYREYSERIIMGGV
jgi:hypothetical protein